MLLGREQIFNPNYSIFEKIYISIFGMPIVGLRIRGRNLFSLIPSNHNYKTILDAGSGTGVFTFELARRFKTAVINGIDLDKKNIEISNHIALKANISNIEFLHKSIEDMNSSTGYNLVICIDILEHIENDRHAIKKLYSLLSNKGILVLHVPALYRRYPIWKKRLNFDVPTHVRPGYTLKDIKMRVSESGFKINNHGYTYGFLESLANNISYMITKANKENKLLYAFLFPVLNIISFLGARARPNELGAGIYIIAEK